MTIFWKIVAALLAVGAVAWIIVENFDRAFLFAAAGTIAWFLSYRAQLREKLTANEQERETDEDEVEEEESL